MNETITALVLAGSRPGGDPLTETAAVATKALLPVGGRPMVDHVVRTLVSHPRIGRIIVMAQDVEGLLDHAQTAWMKNHPKVGWAASGAGISQSVTDWLDGADGTFPILVTTADNVLLDGAAVDAFLAGTGGADIAAAMVERAVLMRAYPASRRTWLKFRGGAWSGANLFWLGNARAKQGLAKWREIEQDRKKGWKIVSAFGPALLLGAALRLLTLDQAVARAGRRLGVSARIVPMPMAEACIDADKPEDVTLIEIIIARRNAV